MNDKRLERIESKIDTLTDKLAETNVILGKQHVSLDYHIKRTDLLEKIVLPIKTHVARVDGAIKLIAIVSAALTIAKLIGWI